MGSSSGSGSFVFGGSLSSSTLSPLAPPFNFDKSHQKPNPTNPSINLFEGPVYGTVFDPAGPFWNSSSSSSASRPNYVAAESTGTNYSYPVSQSSNSHSSVLYVNPNHGVPCDPFPSAYSHFQNSISTSADEGAKPYYSSFVYPPPAKDGYVGLGVVKGHGYDLLSTSDSGNCSGYGSSHIDHTQGLSVGGYSKPKWGDFWSGVNDGKHSEWKDYAPGFGSKGTNFSGLSSSKSHLSVDGSSHIHPFSEASNECLLKQGSCSTQDLDCHRNVSTGPDSFYDIFSGAYPALSLGIGQQDYKSSFDLNLEGISTDCSKFPAFVSVSASGENPHLQRPVLESVTSFCGAQMATDSANKDCFSQTGPFVFSSSTTSTPITMSKLPYGGSNFTALSTLTGTKVNHSDAVHKSIPSTGCDSSGQKEPQIPRGLKCQSSITIKRPLTSLKEPSSTQIGETGNRPVDKDASDKTKLTPIVPHQFSLDGFGREADGGESIFSVEKHSGETDIHNPAEDSPCWKGASSTRFSPFGVSESVVPVALVKNLDGDDSPKTQETQDKTFHVDTSHSVDLSAEEVNESTSLKRPSVSACTSKDHEDFGLKSLKPHCFDLNNGAEIHYVNERHVYTEESNVQNKTKTNSDSSFATQWNHKDGEASSERNISESAEKKGGCCPTAAYSFSGIPFNIGNNLCSSPPGDKSSLKYCQSPPKVSDSRIDINMVLKTMMCLSEVFRDYCSNNSTAVMQQHSETIRHIIDNLSASILMTNGSTTPNMLVSSQGASYQKKVPASDMVGIPKSVASALKLSRRTDDFLDSFPYKNDSITSGNDSMIEAIKKILLENIQEEEIDEHKLLYKNLWLEAEAALCAVTAKARLHHLKVEMEKTCASTKDMGKPPSSNISSDVNNIIESTSKDEGSPALVVHDLASPRTSATSQCEVSVINKFHIPNSQVSLNLMKCEALKSTREEIYSPSLHTTSSCALGNNCHDSGTISNANDIATSVAARYQILRDRIDPFDSLNYGGELSQGEDNCLLDGTISNANDVETSVTARYQILKERIDPSDSLNYEGELSQGEDNCLLEKNFSSLETFGDDPGASVPNNHSNDVETSALGRYHIINCRDDRADSLNNEGNQSSGEEFYLPDNVFSDTDKPFQNSQLFNIFGATDVEASVMGRFRILQNRIDCLNAMNKDLIPGQGSRPSANVAAQGVGWSKQVGQSFFGPYPDFTRHENVKDLDVCVNGEAASTQSFKANNLSSKILEGWYDNGCLSSEWEHVSKEDLQRQH